MNWPNKKTARGRSVSRCHLLSEALAGLKMRAAKSSVARRPGLAERKSEQARAQQHKAGRSQREESVGYKVMIAHGTPATHDIRPN